MRCGVPGSVAARPHAHTRTGEAIGEQDGETQPAELGVAPGEAQQREALLDRAARGVDRRVGQQLTIRAEVAGGAVDAQAMCDLPQPRRRRAACELVDGGVGHRSRWPAGGVELGHVAQDELRAVEEVDQLVVAVAEDDAAARGAAPIAVAPHARAKQRPRRPATAAAPPTAALAAATAAAAVKSGCKSASCRRAHGESRIGRHPLWERRLPFGPAAIIARSLRAWHPL